MRYGQIYENLVERARSRDLHDKSERHHVVPRCMGGSDDAQNLVNLTLREHFVAHQLLAKLYGGKLRWAAHMMSSFERFGSRRYSWLRQNLTMSEEHRRRMSESQRGRVLTTEHKEKLAQYQSRRPDDHNRAIAAALTGKTDSESAKKNKSAAAKIAVQKRERKPCPVCGAMKFPRELKLYHGDRCKSMPV